MGYALRANRAGWNVTVRKSSVIFDDVAALRGDTVRYERQAAGRPRRHYISERALW